MSREQDRLYTAVDLDAAELRGASEVAGDWDRALRVVRCVKRAQGRRTDLSRVGEVPKVSAAEFSRRISTTGYGPNALTRTLESWDRAAGERVVPPADDISPGQGIDRDVWTWPPERSWDEFKVKARKVEPSEEEKWKKSNGLRPHRGISAINSSLGNAVHSMQAAMKGIDRTIDGKGYRGEQFDYEDLNCINMDMIDTCQATLDELRAWLEKTRAVEV